MRRFVLFPLFLLSACIPQPRSPALPVIDTVAVTARAIPLNPQDPAQSTIGQLRYLGGLQLDSSDSRFGGLSGLRFHDGQFLSVSDQGDFVQFRAIETGDRLIGIDQVRVRRLNDLDGRPIATKRMGDAEAIELVGKPVRVVIAFEGRNQLFSYALEGGMAVGRPVELDIARDWRKALPANGGLEAMATTGDAWLLLSEEKRNARGEADGRLELGGEEQVFGLPVADSFSPTDAAIVESGDGVGVLVLQRRFTLGSGVAARLSAFTIVAGEDGAAEAGDFQTLATLRPPLSIDNMEGLAVRQEGKRTFVYIISDDNFTPAQRTLLLKFEVVR